MISIFNRVKNFLQKSTIKVIFIVASIFVAMIFLKGCAIPENSILATNTENPPPDVEIAQRQLPPCLTGQDITREEINQLFFYEGRYGVPVGVSFVLNQETNYWEQEGVRGMYLAWTPIPPDGTVDHSKAVTYSRVEGVPLCEIK